MQINHDPLTLSTEYDKNDSNRTNTSTRFFEERDRGKFRCGTIGERPVAATACSSWADASQRSDTRRGHRSRRAWLSAPVAITRICRIVCHLANIARATGRTLSWDPKREIFLGEDAPNQLVTRERRLGFELPA